MFRMHPHLGTSRCKLSTCAPLSDGKVAFPGPSEQEERSPSVGTLCFLLQTQLKLLRAMSREQRGKEGLQSRAGHACPPLHQRKEEREQRGCVPRERGQLPRWRPMDLGLLVFSAAKLLYKGHWLCRSWGLTPLSLEMLSINLECSPTTSPCRLPLKLEHGGLSLSSGPRILSPEECLPGLAKTRWGKSLSYRSCQTWLSTELESFKIAVIIELLLLFIPWSCLDLLNWYLKPKAWNLHFFPAPQVTVCLR